MAKRLKPYIADIHCHVLPAVDDGSHSIEETLQMLAIAQEEGITHMVLTPHYKAHRRRYRRRELEAIFADLKQQVEEQGIPIRLYLGNEVLFYSDIEEAVERGSIITMNGSPHMLVEFMPEDDFSYIRNGLQLISSLDYIPVLAHVERYRCIVKKPALAEQLVSQGIKLQLNAGSITGSLGFGVKSFCHKLLKAKLISYVATDAHSANSRAPRIKACYEHIAKKYGSTYANQIFFTNAQEDFDL